MSVRARARVTITLEVEAGSVWGADCTFEEVEKQASRDVLQQLANRIGGTLHFHIIGDPKVVAVLVEGS